MNAAELHKIDLSQFGSLFLKEPERLSDQELLSMDFLLHKTWSLLREGHLISFASNDWSAEDLVDLHGKVLDSMSKRGFQHPIKDTIALERAVAVHIDLPVIASPAADTPSPVLEKRPVVEPMTETAHDDPGTTGSDEFLFVEDPEEIDKGIRQAFGSYGGKRVLAHKIASYIPYHRTYVEPFAGGGAVFFAKDPSPVEVLNDRDGEIAFMYRFIRDHSSEDRTALERRDWTVRKDIHERLKELDPENERARFYKNYYLTRSSYGKQRGRNFNPANEGARIDFPSNVERAQKRLLNVAIHNKDYRKILQKYDGPETFFYIDPPYPETFNLFDFGFDEEQFLKSLERLKAKWIVSYPVERERFFKRYNLRKVKRRNQMKGAGGNQEWVTEILASNFDLEPAHLYIEKAMDPSSSGEEDIAPLFLPHVEDQDELEKVQAAFKSPGGKFKLFKKIIKLMPEHERFVEPFCGGAQVFFHKKRSDEEVINDVNPDLAFSYRFMKGMSEQDLEWLKKQYWIITKSHAAKVFKMEPRTPRERFYRFAYLNKAHYWGRADVQEAVRTGEKGEGYHIQLVKRLPEIQERLQGVKVHNWDWQQVLKEYDGPNAFFYLDPPYPLHWPRETSPLKEKFFKEEDLLPALKRLKGQFLLSYELEKTSLFKGFNTYRIKTQWSGSRHDGLRPKYELLVSNFLVKPSEAYVDKTVEGNSDLEVEGLRDCNPGQ